MAATLTIPKRLTALIESGFWPRDHNEAQRQNLDCLVSETVIRSFAPEEDKIFLYPPPFYSITSMISANEGFWSQPSAAVQEIDPDLTLVIGDFGLGSDAPLALDYRTSAAEPRVIRLRWSNRGDDNHWAEVAPTFGAFAAYLTR